MEDKKMLNEEELEKVNGGFNLLGEEDQEVSDIDPNAGNGNNGRHSGNVPPRA